MSELKNLSVDHPYYCSDSNFFSNEARQVWETMSEFLEDMGGADIDMNLCFRWDIRPRGEEGEENGRYCAEIFIIQQRKGIFCPHIVRHVNEAEAEKFKEYAKAHWEVIKKIWNPISGELK